MGSVTFKVDAALLRELGERLVGKPHVALAELIKNAYDADATLVELRILPGKIEVCDDGIGMTKQEFLDYWMRIGSPHKERQKESPKGRPLTGQKGIGRLAVQFLGRRLKLLTKSKDDDKGLKTSVNWDNAVKEQDLTSVELQYERVATAEDFAGGSDHGTKLTVETLSQSWTPGALGDLALQIWSLQPPFDSAEDRVRFRVTIAEAPKELSDSFAAYMQAFRVLAHARIIGKLHPPRIPGGKASCSIVVLFDDDAKAEYVHEIPKCPLRALEFTIAVYSLTGRQPYGVKVPDLREYLRKFGNVGIYDTGFRLPFYGVDTDWLRIQLDHSRRLSLSELLPKEHQFDRGLNFLPTSQRILGEVRVNTSGERTWVKHGGAEGVKPLEIALTRDRLIENEAFDLLRAVVRASLDFYAMQEAARVVKTAETTRKVDRAGSAVQRVAEIVERHTASLPRGAITEIKNAVEEATTAVKLDEDLQAKRANLFGALATAGMASAAFEHETARQVKRLEAIAAQLETMGRKAGPLSGELAGLAEELRQWVTDFRATRHLFTAIAEPENREERIRLRARSFIQQVIERLGPLRRGIPIDVSAVDTEVRLPSGTFVEWSAVFQNVLVNAVNATLDSDNRRIFVSYRNEGSARVILVQDTGKGVDLESSDELFEPFVRRLELSPARRGLGIGGSGLGLSIVRMIAMNLGCRVSFTAPDKGYATAFRLAWSERA